MGVPAVSPESRQKEAIHTSPSHSLVGERRLGLSPGTRMEKWTGRRSSEKLSGAVECSS